MSARENEFYADEALANELTFLLFLERDNRKLAQTFFKSALDAYAKWGNQRKITQLVTVYRGEYDAPSCYIRDLPRASPAASKSEEFGVNTAYKNSVFSYQNSSRTAWLDIHNVIQASQTISTEINFDKLLHSMMKIIIETAGAQTGLLLLYENSVGSPSTADAPPPEGLPPFQLSTKMLRVQAEYTTSGQIKVNLNVPFHGMITHPI